LEWSETDQATPLLSSPRIADQNRRLLTLPSKRIRLSCLAKAVANADPRTPAPTTMISKVDPLSGAGTVARDGIRA
jgi:hypothetical protein